MEDELIRDLIYIFQGIDGKFISYSILDDSYNVSGSVFILLFSIIVFVYKVSIGDQARTMILELCELGWMYKKVTDYVQKHSDNVRKNGNIESY